MQWAGWFLSVYIYLRWSLQPVQVIMPYTLHVLQVEICVWYSTEGGQPPSSRKFLCYCHIQGFQGSNARWFQTYISPRLSVHWLIITSLVTDRDITVLILHVVSEQKRERERERVQYAFHHQFTRPVTNKRQNSNIPPVTFNPTPLSDFSLTQIIVH